MAEERVDKDDLGDGGVGVHPLLMALAGVLVLAATVTVSYLLMGLEIQEVREELAAKADTAAVA